MDTENLLSFLSEIFPNTTRKNQLAVLLLVFAIILENATFPMFVIQKLFLHTYDQNLNYKEISQI